MESIISRGWGCYLYSVAAVVGLLAVVCDAASSCTSTSFNITSQADADLLNSCSTLTGNLVLQSNELAQITFNGIETLNGNLFGSSCNVLRTIAAPNLSKISGNFTISNLPLLTFLQFPLLDLLNGGIYWDRLPQLTSISFGTIAALPNELPGTNVDGDISILDTGLSSLAFLNFTHYSEPNMIWIKGNPRLNTVNLTGLAWGSNSLQILDNGPSAQVLLPDLRSVGDMTISNAGNITLSALPTTDGDVILSNNSLNVFWAPMLTNIEGSLIFRNNALLDDISLPALNSVKGDMTITNNTDLHMIGDMDKLFFCQGIMTLSGDFNIVTLPSLRSVTTGFHLNTTHPSFNCTIFDNLASTESWSQSFYSCGAYAPGSSTDLAIHSTSSSSSQSKHLSKNVKLLVIILSVLAGLFLIALGLKIFVQKTNFIKRANLTRTRNDGVGMGTGHERDVSLEEVGVTRAAEEGDPLPKYTRVGDPGEVPPAYATAVLGADGVQSVRGESGNGSQTSNEPVNGNGIAEMGVMPARVRRRRWIFW